MIDIKKTWNEGSWEERALGICLLIAISISAWMMLRQLSKIDIILILVTITAFETIRRNK